MTTTIVAHFQDADQAQDALADLERQGFTADQVSNARSALEEIAAEVFGEPMTIDVKTDSPTAGAPAAKSSSPLRDDPVVQAFQKHLGADIVESRKH